MYMVLNRFKMNAFIWAALLFVFALVILFCHSFLASVSENEHSDTNHPHAHTVLVSNRSVLDSFGVVDAIPLATNVLLRFMLVSFVVALNVAWFRSVVHEFLSIRLFLRMQRALCKGIMHSKRFHFFS